ncbi:MAG: hypothetical protein GJ676_10885 [Rhodobacteraceae bacterium]|nr:hypothetical protein [Paracoccaceae bacterium]
MEQRNQHTATDDVSLSAALREPARKPGFVRIAGWCLVVGCALSMGAILVTNPMVGEKLSTLTEFDTSQDADDLPAAGTAASQDVDASDAEFKFPIRTIMAVGSVSQSARSALGLGSPMDAITTEGLNLEGLEITGLDPKAADQDTETQGSSFFSGSSSSNNERPTVSVLPQSRVPVRRAGVSTSN